MSVTVTNEEEVSIFKWVRNGTAVTTGTVTAQIIRREQGTQDVEYLQSNLSTWSTTVHDFTVSSVGDEWHFFWTVPASAEGYNISVIATHSTEPTTLTDGPYYVTEADTDDLVEAAGFDNTLDFG